MDELRSYKTELLELLTGATAAMQPPDAALLAWAGGLAEQELCLPDPVTYAEAPMRTVTTARVSWYATEYLRTVTSARIHQQTGGWGLFTPEWWRQREREALGALEALRAALDADTSSRNAGPAPASGQRPRPTLH